MEARIALCITVHNRSEIAQHSIEQWRKLAPINCDIFIVDDASNPPCPDADYRFENNVGISTAKNMCLQLAENAEHVFLADEDIYALDNNWATYYTHSNLQHACYIFDRKLLWAEPDYKAYELPRGCLLYFTRRCINITGGFDTNFKNSYEHAELSRRIFNMKLTPAPYIDIPNSKGLFYSHDEQGTALSSMTTQERVWAMRTSKKYFEETKLSNSFIPYK